MGIISILMIIIFLISYLLYKANRNTYDVKFNTVSPDINSIPASQSVNLRILHLSDLHLENLSVTPERLYDQLKHESYDLITITGDFLDQPKSIPLLEPYLEALKRLEPKFGTYAVFGNHDYRLSEKYFQELKMTLKKHNITIMTNENKTIVMNNAKVHIIGIDDYHTKKSNLPLSFHNVLDDDGFRLVLTHDPNLVVEMDQYSFDYMLAGHFHGGQICWPRPYHLRKFGKLVRLNLIKGLIEFRGKMIYINEGLGQTLFNIRLGSRPEITVHEVKVRAQAVYNEEMLEQAI